MASAEEYLPDSVGEYIDYLGPGLLARTECPSWPPDVFALTTSVLHRTGAYIRVLELPAPDGRGLLDDRWPERARALGASWRKALNEALTNNPTGDPSFSIALPPEIQGWWATLRSSHILPLTAVIANDDVCSVFLRLCIVADEASIGVCEASAAGMDAFLLHAKEAILDKKLQQTLCQEISAEKVRVLPKQHTPQRGITVRSLSHHLALCPAGEVRVTWRTFFDQAVERDLDLLNFLLVPWPLKLTARNFQEDTEAAKTTANRDLYSFFSFRRATASKEVENFDLFLKTAIEVAQEHALRIDGVILPEFALTVEEYEKAEVIAIENNLVLIAGVARPIEDSRELENVCLVQPAGILRADTGDLTPKLREGLRVQQIKHHRWCLDRNQIIQYGLGGMLPVGKDCWEYSRVAERNVHFVTLGSWLTLSVLLCEDLARQDPVSDVLRAVGPNLVIALLMDGPQLRSRWPSRYASVLAEDPGKLVLTLTSLGMSARSQPREGDKSRSRVIALWRDVLYGEREIELPDGCNACVLSLVSETLEEYTADGRGDLRSAYFPVFAGLHPLTVPTTAP